MFSRLKTANALRHMVGCSSAAQLSVAHIANLGPAFWRGRPEQLEHDVTLRLRGSSDFAVFKDIFIAQPYACLRDLADVSVVLDLGANVGLSAAYFLNLFPNSRVLAVEPDERNVAVCRLNLSGYGDRATVLQGAAWSECGYVNLLRGEFRDGREWATQVAAGDGDVKAWDMPALIAMAGAPIDLLKVDIERAETELFSGDVHWLDSVRNICIELHGDDCRDVFFRAMAQYEYDLSESGELTICRNLR